MGAFLVNFHVRSGDHQRLMREIGDLRLGSCYVATEKTGWASVYEERASTQDDQWIRWLGGELSRRMQAPAIAFLVHDSDFVCYWLFDLGERLDEFNSHPDYFDDWREVSAVETLRGRPDVLVKYCRRGAKISDIETVLGRDPLFAEGQLEELARLLGIDVERATTDFGDFGREIDPDEFGATFAGTGEPRRTRSPFGGLSVVSAADDDLDADEFEDVKLADGAPSDPRGLLGRSLERLMGLSHPAIEPDPKVAELVKAAAEGDLAAIERLVNEGADINSLAPLKIDLNKQVPGLGQLAAVINPSFNLFPLLAAVTNKQLEAAQRLISLGSDVNLVHPLFGTAVHAAVSAGSPELLKLLLDCGARVNERNAQGQTPLAALAAARQVLAQFTRLQSLGLPLPGIISARLSQSLPTAGWDACEQLLRDAGAQ